MTKYKVRLQAEAREDANDVMVEAMSVKANADWVVFYSGTQDLAHAVVAAFPKDRVIGVTTVES
ncbi:MAG: hypothetical protein ACLP36_05780 [Acidimicrobiales bacterium]|jgi:hypothetical protein